MIRFIGAMVRTIGNIVMIAIVLVGIPWASIRYVGWPLPRSVPDGPTLQAWFDDPFATSRFWKAVSIVGWLVWAVLAYAFVVEVLSELGRIRRPRFRLAAPFQGLAAGMVGATATALTAPAAHAAPPAAVAAAVPDLDTGTPAPATSAPVYVVQHGDWLSTIAERFLGNPDAYPRIQALNPNLEARDARFPNHIEPGWRLVLPADAHDRGIRRHASGRLIPSKPALGPTGVGAAPPAPISEPADPLSGDREPDEDFDGTDAPFDDDLDAVSPVTTGHLAGAGLLASLALGALAAERRRQQQRTPLGQPLPVPRSRRIERDLRAVQRPADVARLDAALRHLTKTLQGRDRLPDIVGVRMIGPEVHLLLAGHCPDPPAPWLDEYTQWALPGYHELPDVSPLAAPLPVLAAIGSRAGRHLLLDLERLGVLTIGGDPTRVGDLMRYLACELACTIWCDEIHLTVAGFGDDTTLLTEVNPSRVVVADSTHEAIAALQRRLHNTSTEDVLSQRVHHNETHRPHVLLIANPSTDDLAAITDLDRSLASRDRAAVAIVVATPEPLSRSALTLSADGTVSIATPWLRMTTDAAGLPADDLEDLAEIMQMARQIPSTSPPADLPEWGDHSDPTDSVVHLYDPSRWQQPTAADSLHHAAVAPTIVPTGSIETDLDDDLAAWYRNDPTRPRISLLGPIEIHASGPVYENRRRLSLEILLYLIARGPTGATRDQIIDAVWSGAEVDPRRARAAISEARTWLGKRPDRTPWIPSGERTHRIQPGLLCDWQMFCRLRDRASDRGAAGISDLRAALELVRGIPLDGADDPIKDRNPFTWLRLSDLDPGRITAAINDVAHRYATACLDTPDLAGARWAVERAWLADRHRGVDELWLDLMRVEYAEGNAAAVRQLYRALLTTREIKVPEELQPATYQALRTLVPDLA